MSKLSELQGKSKTYKIGNIEIDLRPLRLDDMKLVAINNDSTPEQQQEAAKALISKTLEMNQFSNKYILKSSEINFNKSGTWQGSARVHLIRTNRSSN